MRESKIPNAPQIPLDEYMHILDTKVKILEERCNYIFAPLSGGKKSKKRKMNRRSKKRKKSRKHKKSKKRVRKSNKKKYK